MKTTTKNEWREITLGDIAEKIGMGPFGSNIKVDTFVTDGVPVISGAHLRGARLEDGDYNFVSREHADRLASANVRRGDVIFTHAGNIGQVAYIPGNSKYERYILSQRQFYLRPGEGLSAEYLTYYFHSPIGRHQLLTYANQVGVPSIAQPVSNLRATVVSLPSIEEQRSIVAVIKSFDDKIELLRKQNETLEQIALMMFEERFENGLSEGWDIGRVKDVMNVLSGFAFKSADFDDSGKYKLVTIRNVQDGYFVEQTSDHLAHIPTKMPAYCSLHSGDILLSLTGNVGRVCYVIGNDFLLNQRVAKIEARNKNDIAFAYLFFRRPVVLRQLERLASGTAQQNLSPIKTGDMEMIVPTRIILDEFATYANPLVRKMHANSLQIRQLVGIRETLLPRLISGKIRV